MNSLLQDLRYGARMLRNRPGFTIVAVVTLALGIGANTAIFSVVNAVLLRPLPYADPDRLLMVWEKPPRFPRNSVAVANYLDWKNQNKVFEQVAARTSVSFNLSGDDRPEKVSGMLVSPNYFELFGVTVALGRTFAGDEDQPGKERVAIITNGLWQRRFGADPHLIGKPIQLDGESYTVVGVLKADSAFERMETHIYTPLAFAPDRINRRSHFLTVLARLKPGVTIEQAQADMDGIAASIAEQSPETNKGWGVTLDHLRDRIISHELRQTLLILFGAVILVLLIACANLANLTLARAADRHKEISIRAALGATRWQLIKQIITESVLLSLVGGALGVAVGYWLVDAIRALMPPSVLPAEAALSIDRPVLLFTLTVSVLTGVAFGLAPAWQASKADLNEALKEEGRSSTRAGHRYLSRLLVVSEVALALLLLIGSGLLIRSLFRLQGTELGFQPSNVLTLHVTLPQTKYRTDEQVLAFHNEALRRIQSLPGVERAAAVTDLPTSGWTYGMFFGIEGHPSESPSERPGAHEQVVSPDYFSTLAIPVIRGRSFTERDTSSAPPVIIINDTLARRYFPGQDPVGKHLVDDSKPPRQYEIVGVVGNVKVYGLGDKAPDENSEIYLPLAQSPSASTYFAVRTTEPAPQLASAAQREIQAIDKDQPVTNVSSMEQVVAATLADERFNTLLLGFFAAVAATLAAVGIYGVISYMVTQRTREIAIRMALGAQTGDVLRMVVGQGMAMAVVGISLGLVAAFAVMRLISSLLFGVSATDPLTFAAVPLVLCAVALVACYIPARRAMKVDPMEALRYE